MPTGELILALLISLLVVFLSVREVWLFYRWLTTTRAVRPEYRKSSTRTSYTPGTAVFR
jgi:hypothetical protein